DRAHRATHYRRSLVVSHFMEVTKNHDLPIVWRQRQHRLAHPLDGLGLCQLCQQIALCRGFPRSVETVAVREVFRQRYIWTLAFEIPQCIISSDSIQERFQRALRRIELSGLADQRHEDFLCYL